MIDLFGVPVPAIYIHLLTLVVTGVCVLVADKDGLAWVRGNKMTLSARRLGTLHALVSVGLVLMVLSGALLAYPMLSYLVTEPSFWIKMAFVLLLCVNAFFIGTLMNRASTTSFADVPSKEKRLMLLSGAASGVGWVGAVVAALFMTTSQWILYFLGQFVALF